MQSGIPPESPVSMQQVNRVAAVTLGFWLLKIIITTLGDLSGDLLSMTLGLGYLHGLMVSALVMALLLAYQFSIKRFQVLGYWVLMLVSACLGAELSDALARAFDLSESLVTLLLLICWAATLFLWFLGTGKIRASVILNRKDELFYWLAVILANSLGSVLGDYLADQFGIGLAGRVGISVGILALLWILNTSTRLNKAILFWVAFVFSRVWV